MPMNRAFCVCRNRNLVTTYKIYKIMKKDIFNIEISVYNGVKDVYGTTCKLRAFLFDKKHIAEIENLRSLPTKEEKNEIKRRLPMACISGVFSPTVKPRTLLDIRALSVWI